VLVSGSHWRWPELAQLIDNFSTVGVLRGEDVKCGGWVITALSSATDSSARGCFFILLPCHVNSLSRFFNQFQHEMHTLAHNMHNCYVQMKLAALKVPTLNPKDAIFTSEQQNESTHLGHV